jgi:2-oxoglutarate ferredoxin oxidoreductase subunit alpha
VKLDIAVEDIAKLRSIRHYNGLPIDARTITDNIISQEGK